MKTEKLNRHIPPGKVYVEWESDATVVREMDDLEAREGRTRDALIEVALTEYLARDRRTSARKHKID